MHVRVCGLLPCYTMFLCYATLVHVGNMLLRVSVVAILVAIQWYRMPNMS